MSENEQPAIEIATPMNDVLSPNFVSKLDPYFSQQPEPPKRRRRGKADYIAEAQKRRELIAKK